VFDLLWKLGASLGGITAGIFSLFIGVSLILETWLTKSPIYHEGNSAAAKSDFFLRCRPSL